MSLVNTAVCVCGLLDMRPHDIGEAGSPVTEAEQGEDEGKNPGESGFGQHHQFPGGQVYH